MAIAIGPLLLLVLAVLAIVVLVAHTHDALVSLVRATGQLITALLEALLHVVVHLIGGVTLLLTRAWPGLRDHAGPQREGGHRYHRAWDAVVALTMAALFAVLLASDYIYASRIGVLLGAPVATNESALDVFLGVMYVLTTVVLGAAAADACNISPAGTSIIFSRLSPPVRRHAALALGVCVAVALVNTGIFAAWTAEAALAQVNDLVLATIFLVVFAVLLNIALIVSALPLFTALGVLATFAAEAARLALFLMGVGLYMLIHMVARFIQALEMALALLALLGRLIWNPLARRLHNPILGVPPRLPLINTGLTFPRLRGDAITAAVTVTYPTSAPPVSVWRGTPIVLHHLQPLEPPSGQSHQPGDNGVPTPDTFGIPVRSFEPPSEKQVDTSDTAPAAIANGAHPPAPAT